MAFDILGPETCLSDDSCDYEVLVFAHDLDESTPRLETLLAGFYSDVKFTTGEAAALKMELLKVKAEYGSEWRN